jgi:hypothetical protein
MAGVPSLLDLAGFAMLICEGSDDDGGHDGCTVRDTTPLALCPVSVVSNGADSRLLRDETAYVVPRRCAKIRQGKKITLTNW